MLLEPTEKYSKYIFNSKHYLNCPKHMFNFNVNSLVRGYDREIAISNLRWFFGKYGYPLKDVESIVDYHMNIKVWNFDKINVNSYIDNPPKWTESKSKSIEEWVRNNTEPATYWNRYPNTPSYPFQTQ